MNLKRLIVLFIGFIFVSCIFLSCLTVSHDYAQPTIDKQNTFVIDSYSVAGNLKDHIRLINRSTNHEMMFKVYVHDPNSNTWIDYGIGQLRRINDTDFISSGLQGKLNNYRYFAIEALDGNNYRYEIVKTRNDLYISILNI